MLMAGRMHPPFLFCRAKRETGRARSKEKSVGALRCSGPPRDGGRRIGASADLARPSGTLYSSAISPTAVPWRIVRRSSGWSSHGAASLFAAASCPARELPIKASAPTTARAARSEAERAERGAGQMRPCTPLTSASTPRESAFKPVPHPAAPVGQSSQTRRHHLTPTPVQQLCTPVQSCGQKRSFLLDRARPVFFSGKTEKKMGGCIPLNKPLAGAKIPEAAGRRPFTTPSGPTGQPDNPAIRRNGPPGRSTCPGWAGARRTPSIGRAAPQSRWRRPLAFGFLLVPCGVPAIARLIP